MDPIAKTSRWTAAARARETARPDRLFEDPYAERLATDLGFQLLGQIGSFDGDNPFIVVRTRFLDDFLRGAVRAGGQVVLLAAGVDARAWRMTWPAGIAWYELDRAEVLDAKREVLAGAVPACAVHPVAVDLLGDWEPALLAAGFDPARPSVWLAEGLLVYLDDAQARGLLSRAAALAAPGSRLAADLPGLSLLRSAMVADTLRRMEAMGAAWRFGTDDPEGLMVSCGWRDPIVARPGDPDVRYGRWPWPTPPRGTPGVPESYFIVAAR